MIATHLNFVFLLSETSNKNTNKIVFWKIHKDLNETARGKWLCNL